MTSTSFNWKAHIDLNLQPVIGIFTQTIKDLDEFDKPEAASTKVSYIMSSYVKYLQGAGARVVPLILTDDADVTWYKIKNLNGVLFPGGDGDYRHNAKEVFDFVIKENDRGHFYPLWGTCLGFQHFATFTADVGKAALTQLALVHKEATLDFLVNPAKTKMFEDLGDRAYEFSSHNFTYNNHHFGVAPELFSTDNGLKTFWDLTSQTIIPNNGTAFVATIEAKNYPFFGVQFHPEKPSSLWADGVSSPYNINHSWQNIQISEHFAKLFVGMARANTNTFGTYMEYQPNDISNYEIEQNLSYGDRYVFD